MWRAPIRGCALKLVLITKRLARAKVDSEEIDLDVVLIRIQLEEREGSLAERRQRSRDAGDAQRADQDGW
jgi:hypothetical protein